MNLFSKIEAKGQTTIQPEGKLSLLVGSFGYECKERVLVFLYLDEI